MKQLFPDFRWSRPIAAIGLVSAFDLGGEGVFPGRIFHLIALPDFPGRISAGCALLRRSSLRIGAALLVILRVSCHLESPAM
jgi:hypothetical protein